MANLKFDISKLVDGLSVFESKVDSAVGMYCETSAKKLEADAKKDAKWTDRSGAARQRLTGYTLRTGTGWRIYLAHGVDYGIWLELAHEKRFAIVGPLIELKGPIIMKGFKNLIDKLGFPTKADYSSNIHTTMDDLT